MYQLDFNKPINIYFCGIGGISMSALAFILLDAGFKISGSDRASSELTERLKEEGACIFIGQGQDNVTEDVDVFVYTAAIKKDHPEFIKAEKLGIPMLTRAELLGQMMKNYKNSIAISGTHGKTTVTSMISEIFMAADEDPTLLVGGILESIGGNIRIGHSDTLVTEACEYTNSFLSFFPTAGIILNIEEDHLDFFKDINDIRNSFRKFASLVSDNGIVIINADIDEYKDIVKDAKAGVVTFGKGEGADYYAENVRLKDDGGSTFTLKSAGYGDGEFELRIPGRHNVTNALASIALADHFGIDRDITKKAIASFGGTKRRFEYKGECQGFKVYDDYAHHPSEIRATLSAAAGYPKNRLWCVFQPHTYSRTKAFLDDFAKALSLADVIVLADIYAARETDDLGISSGSIAEILKTMNKECYYFHSFEEIQNFVKENCTQNDMLITMGAGDIVNVADALVR